MKPSRSNDTDAALTNALAPIAQVLQSGSSSAIRTTADELTEKLLSAFDFAVDDVELTLSNTKENSIHRIHSSLCDLQDLFSV